jgi:hypothetical protein
MELSTDLVRLNSIGEGKPRQHLTIGEAGDVLSVIYNASAHSLPSGKSRPRQEVAMSAALAVSGGDRIDPPSPLPTSGDGWPASSIFGEWIPPSTSAHSKTRKGGQDPWSAIVKADTGK